ncbi:hypothetical protein J4G33_04295 [Actinotalea sp. BY-33]|uniref:Lipoprotein n=1 Tax=Actinotalea soli TaxID=2819234 RepID=A0A939LMS1_9CELL|nr:hypothetical protein [Actinotalea soli]MBO1751017.1 hypothetical protein [Actinotalea soli]
MASSYRSRIAPAAASVLAVVGLVGCAPSEAQTCVDWVDFASPEHALADAELAVTGEVLEAAGATDLYGAQATVWSVRVTGEPLAGEPPPGDEIRVISTPVTCTGEEIYPGGDPLDTAGPLILLLTSDEADGDWRTITPRQGAVPAGPDGELPLAWPEDEEA